MDHKCLEPIRLIQILFMVKIKKLSGPNLFIKFRYVQQVFSYSHNVNNEKRLQTFLLGCSTRHCYWCRRLEKPLFSLSLSDDYLYVWPYIHHVLLPPSPSTISHAHNTDAMIDSPWCCGISAMKHSQIALNIYMD